MKRKILLMFTLIIGLITMAACGGNEDSATKTNDHGGSSGHESSDLHTQTGDLPAGLKSAESPTYPVGSKAIITANHMKGMEGAEATIVGAFDTTAYVVSYNPTTGGERVQNHKWIIQEEIDQAPDMPIEPNSEVSLNADHMPGMKGAVAVTEDLEETTVYMVDYTSTTGEKVKNHKWVTEEELKPLE